MQIKLIFTRKVVHLASFWKWGFLELGSGIFTNVVTFLYRGGFNLYFLFKGEGWQFVIWPIRVCAAEQGMVLRGLGLKKGFSVFNRMCCWTGSFWNVRSINLCYQQLFLTNQVPWSYFYKLLNSVSLRKRIRVIPIRSIVLNRVAKWTIFALKSVRVWRLRWHTSTQTVPWLSPGFLLRDRGITRITWSIHDS